MKNKNFYTMMIIMVFFMINGFAQPLSEFTGVRLYEHHSPTIAGGTGANPAYSGVDFVNNTYYDSFDPATFNGWQNGEEANIDMVEHNGPTTSGGDFGFTSGVSSIWGGLIKGNGLTKYMLAPTGFDYNAITDVSQIVSAYDPNQAVMEISHAAVNTVYLAQIRNSNLYVAISIYNVVNPPPGSYTDAYFDFDYKYGTYTSTNIHSLNDHNLNIFPNPFQNEIVIDSENKLDIEKAVLMSCTGKLLKEVDNQHSSFVIDTKHLQKGIYFIKIYLSNDQILTEKIIKL